MKGDDPLCNPSLQDHSQYRKQVHLSSSLDALNFIFLFFLGEMEFGELWVMFYLCVKYEANTTPIIVGMQI